MSQLPARPDLDQLRRQARELYRAALDGDARALHCCGRSRARSLCLLPSSPSPAITAFRADRKYPFRPVARVGLEVDAPVSVVVAGVLGDP
jgi:hypothetical protein